MTKIVKNHVKPLLNNFISLSQSSFIPGRNIHQSSQYYYNTWDDLCDEKNEGVKGVMSIKIGL